MLVNIAVLVEELGKNGITQAVAKKIDVSGHDIGREGHKLNSGKLGVFVLFGFNYLLKSHVIAGGCRR